MPYTISVVPAATSPSNAVVVSKAVVRAARSLGLNNAALTGVVGLSEATISRLASGSYTLDPESKPYELALLLIRLSSMPHSTARILTQSHLYVGPFCWASKMRIDWEGIFRTRKAVLLHIRTRLAR